MYIVPTTLEKILLSYVKKRYLPQKRLNPKTADEFTHHDIEFFADGVAEMSAYFTSERSQLPKNYLNKKELRAGYILYFVMTNFLKAVFCLEEINALERFKGKDVVKIADIGCGPGTASLAVADYWRRSEQRVEISAVDQNTNSLHDAKHIFSEFAGENVKLKTVYSHLHPKSISHALKEKFDIIIAENFLNEIGDVQRQENIIDVFFSSHLNKNGVVIIIEPALRWTTRNLMKLRDCLLDSQSTSRELRVLSPCLHEKPCPMLKTGGRDWCHMYLNWKRPDIIAKIDALVFNRKDYLKFSYLVLTKEIIPPNKRELWRVVSSPMHTKGKAELLLCNKTGLLRTTRQDKNASPSNSDFDRVKRGDLVSFSGQAVIEKNTGFKIIF